MPTYFPILEISTTVGCKMRCGYCPQATHVKKYAARSREYSLSLATFETCLASVPPDVQVMFAGMAEPWLNPAATDMVLAAQAKGHAVSIYTTLAGMTLADVDRLAGVTLTHLCVHLPDALGVMKLDVTPAWLATLAALKTRGIPHHFVVYGPLHPWVREALGHDVRDDSGGLLSRAGNLADRTIPRKTGALTCSACGPKIDHNVLLPNGDVALCCMVYDLKHILGNLTTQTWASLFEGAEYQKVMAGLAGDESIDIACRTCEMAVAR